MECNIRMRIVEMQEWNGITKKEREAGEGKTGTEMTKMKVVVEDGKSHKAIEKKEQGRRQGYKKRRRKGNMHKMME